MKFQLSLILSLLVCFTSFAAPPKSANFLPACPLPPGVVTLDDLAGDWKSRAELEQFPSIHNFDAELLVNKDFASVSWLASPPFSQGFHSGAFKLNGRVPVAEKFKWFPYQAVRAGAADGLAIETINRMVFDDRGSCGGLPCPIPNPPP